MKAPHNYCLLCGKKPCNESLLCEDHYGEKLTNTYNANKTQHCTYCNKILDYYFDYTRSGTLISTRFLCFACASVFERSNFDKREYLPPAFPYMESTMKNEEVPVHVKQAFERQQQAMK